MTMSKYTYSYEWTPDQGVPNCPACGDSMRPDVKPFESLRYMVCDECGLRADTDTGECEVAE